MGVKVENGVNRVLRIGRGGMREAKTINTFARFCKAGGGGRTGEEAPRRHQGGTREAMAHWAVLPTKYFVLRNEVLKI